LAFLLDGHYPPVYILAKIVMATGLLAIFVILQFLTLLYRENKKRNKEKADMGGYDDMVDSEVLDTDKENKDCRCSY
jgi:hypothetical protein